MTSLAVAAAATFTWLGMVLAISSLEAPLKFRVPGVTVQIGLRIGTVVFRALNIAESVLGVILLIAVFLVSPPARITVAALVPAVVLAAQLTLVRPRLNRRTRAVLAGAGGPRSRGHHAYIALEVAKVCALIVVGVALLAA